MAKINRLDNLAGQEIKKLITDNQITVDELDILSLEKLLDYETDLLCQGGGDMELIETCTRLLDKAEGGSPVSEEEFEKDVRHAIAKANREASENRAARDKYNRRKFKVFILAAALLAMALGTMSTGADIVAQKLYYADIGTIAQTVHPGTLLEFKTNTVYVTTWSGSYSTIDEACRAENLEILYPSVLPEEVEILNVCVGDAMDGDMYLHLQFNSFDVDFNVTVNASSERTEFDKSTSEKYESNGIAYYIKKSTDQKNHYFSMSVHKGNYYYICASSRSELISIIDNLKEFEQ